MKTLSNLPPGCTSYMIDELCPDSWECFDCGETLDEDELCECGSCLSLFCKNCVEEDDSSSTDYRCFTCAAARRIKAYSEQHAALAKQEAA